MCDVKIDINMCETHCVNLFFVNLLLSQGVDFFYIWHLFDNLTLTHHISKFGTASHLPHFLDMFLPFQVPYRPLVAKSLHIVTEQVSSFDSITSKLVKNCLQK